LVRRARARARARRRARPPAPALPLTGQTCACAPLPLRGSAGHGWVEEGDADSQRADLLANLPLLRGGASKLLAKYATNTSEIPKLSADEEDEAADESAKPAAKPVKAAAAKPPAPKPAASPPPPPGGKVIALSSAKQLTDLLSAAGPNQLVVLDFTATWCGPCQQIAPVFARLAAELPHVMCVKVDADTHGAILKTYGVKAFPTFVLLRRKSELSRMQGADAGALEAAIRANAGKPDPWSTAKTASGRTLR
jgi:thiol-disulfide isomerase/thioredoxin